MLPLRLFRIRNFAGANLLTLLLYAALGGGLFFFPLNLIQVQGYSATAAGAALLPFILIMFVLSRWAGTLVDRFGSRLPLLVGPVIAAGGFALFALPSVEADYWTTFLPAVVVLGIGMTVTVAPLTTTVMNSVGSDLAGVASGVNNAVSRTAALLAIAIFGMVMAWVFEAGLHERLREAGVSHEISVFLDAQRSNLAGAALPPGVDAAAAATLRRAVELSYVSGFRWIMLLSALLALMSALAAWVLIEGNNASRPGTHGGGSPRPTARRSSGTSSASRAAFSSAESWSSASPARAGADRGDRRRDAQHAGPIPGVSRHGAQVSGGDLDPGDHSH
jgi:predicted MFS family arabinose efflux permease